VTELEQEIAHLQELQARHRKNIHTLEEQLARHGMKRPLDLLNELEFEQEQLRQVEKRLAKLTAQAETVLPPQHELLQPTPTQRQRLVNWEKVGSIAGVIGVLIALGAWLVANAPDFLSAWLSRTPTVTLTSSSTHTPVISTATPTNTPFSPTATPTFTPSPTPTSAGGWQPIPDLPRRITTMVADPTAPRILYASTGIYGSGGGGVYKSEDSGLTWRLAVNGLPNDVVKTLAFSRDVPSTLYANVGPRGDIYASTDGAESWIYVGLDSELCCNFERRMFVSPRDGSVLFIVEFSGGVSRSLDGGQNWLPVKDGRGEIRARSLAIDPTDTNVVYLGTEGNGVYKSTDSGDTWSLANRGMLDYHITALAIDPTHPQTVYAGGDNGELFKSTDGGQTWNDLTDRLPFGEHSYTPAISAIAIDPVAPDTVCLLVERVGVLVSYDGGARWRLLGKPGEISNPSFTAMVTIFDPQLVLVVGIKDTGGWRYAVVQP
jgi:photosystem II stability/assembly factor-like uncharacterized protein